MTYREILDNALNKDPKDLNEEEVRIIFNLAKRLTEILRKPTMKRKE